MINHRIKALELHANECVVAFISYVYKNLYCSSKGGNCLILWNYMGPMTLICLIQYYTSFKNVNGLTVNRYSSIEKKKIAEEVWDCHLKLKVQHSSERFYTRNGDSVSIQNFLLLGYNSQL